MPRTKTIAAQIRKPLNYVRCVGCGCTRKFAKKEYKGLLLHWLQSEECATEASTFSIITGHPKDKWVAKQYAKFVAMNACPTGGVATEGKMGASAEAATAEATEANWKLEVEAAKAC